MTGKYCTVKPCCLLTANKECDKVCSGKVQVNLSYIKVVAITIHFFSQRSMIGFPLCWVQVEKCYLLGKPNRKEKVILAEYVNNFYKNTRFFFPIINYFWTFWICIQVTCLTVCSSVGRGTDAGEVGHLIEALSSIQTGLWLTLVYVWRKHKNNQRREIYQLMVQFHIEISQSSHETARFCQCQRHWAGLRAPNFLSESVEFHWPGVWY